MSNDTTICSQTFTAFMLLLSMYYLYHVVMVPEVKYILSYLKNYNSTKTINFRRRMKNLGISQLSLFQLSIITHNSTQLSTKLFDYFSSHPQCPITLEDVVDDETHHLRPHISAVVQYDDDREEVYWSCFSSDALQRWLTERSLHPLTRIPMSEYVVISLS